MTMEDHLVNNDQLQNDKRTEYPGPQYPGPHYPGPQYPGSTNTVTMAQPVPHVPQIIRSPEDLNVITSIRTKAILSLVLSIVLFLLFSHLFFCTIPAIVFAILALTAIDTNIHNAAKHAKHAAMLTVVAIGSFVFLIIIGAMYIVSRVRWSDDYDRSLMENKGVM